MSVTENGSPVRNKDLGEAREQKKDGENSCREPSQEARALEGRAGVALVEQNVLIIGEGRACGLAENCS